MTVPTILEDIVLQSASKELALLDFVIVGGGPIKDTIARTLQANEVSLLNHFGATELGALAPIFRPDKSYDWQYLRLRTDIGLSLKKIESSSSANTKYKLIGRPFGSDTDFELQDDLEVNPLNPKLEVKLKGRKDDLIVLATGEKVLPHLMEVMLSEHPLIKCAIVFGNGQFEVGILIEPALPQDGAQHDFVDLIWPAILEANTKVDQHARISAKTAILVKPVDKSIPLSDKGSPQRKEVYLVFESEIRSVYTQLEKSTPITSTTSIDPVDARKGLRETVQLCLPSHVESESWQDDDDFVQLGMDSLQATRLRRLLDQSFRQSSSHDRYTEGLPLDFVYTHSSVQKIIAAMEGTDDIDSTIKARSKLLSKLLNKYTFINGITPSRTEVETVLLTGSTGNLGSHILQILCESSYIPHVVCLIRAKSRVSTMNIDESMLVEQRKALEDREIRLSDKAWSKIRLIAWNPGEERLGIRQEDYQSLASTVTSVFHGAWPMDFQMKLPSFEPHIKALYDLVNFVRFAHQLRPKCKPRFIFASSIAVVGKMTSRSSMSNVTESPILDPWNGPLSMGYAEAKWICEQVMESAFYTLPLELQPMIVRIGQLSGSLSSGYWSVREHFPTLVQTSLAIKQLPDLCGVSIHRQT